MTESERIEAESHRVRAEEAREQTIKGTRRARSAFVYSTIIVLLATFTLAIFTVAYTVYMSQRWCGLVTLIDERNKVMPPETDIEKQFANEISKIRKDFFC